MATKGPSDDDHGGLSRLGPPAPGHSADQDMSQTEVMVDLPPNVNSVNHPHKNFQKKIDKIKQPTHVIMINQGGVPTVVSSGGSGHVQHVSVVGHVQHVTGPFDSGIAVMSASEADELTAKKKASSFKITNVYVSRPPSNDGDDSCDDMDDLEDSHTEDLSDIADSLSSQLETVAALNSGLAPSLNGPQHGGGISPAAARSKQSSAHAQSSSDNSEFQSKKTSNDWDQYPHGFGFVTYHQKGDTFHPVSYLDKAVSGAVAVFNSMDCTVELNNSNAPVVGPQDFKTKFKVVKVETTQPLKRGRWTCIDFSDKHTSSNNNDVKTGTAGSTSAGASKPTTKTSEFVPNSRPSSTLPREPAPTEPSTVINSDNTSENSASLVRNDQEASDTLGGLEEKEHEGVKVEVRATSAGPEGIQPQIQGNYPSYPVTSSTTSTPATSNNNGLNISLPQQSVPVITPTPTNSVQSPHTGGQMPDFNSLQNTIGQVIRLNDGTLAQVALAPLPQQQQVMKIIPNSTNQPMVQQQMMVNAQGQHFLVSQQQQQQQQVNINQVPQQQSNRSQIQQPQVAAPPQQSQPQQQQQQPSNRSQQQQTIPSQQQRSQQQSTVQQQQQSVGVPQQQPTPKPTNQGVISNSSALTMQQQQQHQPQPQQPSVVSQQQQPLPQQHSVAIQQHPAASVGSAVQAPSTVAPNKRQSTGVAPGPAHNVTPGGQSRPVTQTQPTVPTVCQNGVTSINNGVNTVTVNSQGLIASVSTSVSSMTPSNVSHPSFYNFGPSGAPQSVFPVNASLDSGFSYSAVNSLIVSDSEGLVERLEDLVSTQFAEDVREGELLELESASGAGQGSIDHRIEQAMDLVKSHLMTAVRSEVEELRDKISKLEDTVTHLSRENEVLRANVNPDVLTSLLGNRSILGSMPPDPASGHPALQPPNQH